MTEAKFAELRLHTDKTYIHATHAIAIGIYHGHASTYLRGPERLYVPKWFPWLYDLNSLDKEGR